MTGRGCSVYRAIIYKLPRPALPCLLVALLGLITGSAAPAQADAGRQVPWSPQTVPAVPAPPPGPGGPQQPTQGLPPGTVTFSINPVSATFREAPGSQSVWEAGPFVVEGTCPLRTWAIVCEVSPLVNAAESYTIPPDRVQVIFLSAATAPVGAKQEPITLAAPVPVLAGGVGTKIGPIGNASFLLRITTDWNDPAGTYVGTIRFSYFAAP